MIVGYDPGKMFPIQGGKQVWWADAETAYETYVKKYGKDQSLKRIAERGGFSPAEFAYYFRGDMGPVLSDWPVDTCRNCRGSGEIVNSEEGGIVMICGECMGAGVLVPSKMRGKT